MNYRISQIITTILLFTFFPIVSYSQVIIDDINLNEREDIHIVQVLAKGSLFTNKVSIAIDYGQFTKWNKDKGSTFLDKDGKKKKFNSVIEALNFMENNGWEYVNALVITLEKGITGKQNVYHYYFKKKKDFEVKD